MHYRARVLVATASTAALLLAGAAPSHATTLATGGDGTLGSSVTEQPTAATYDGQTLFAGLMLGYGPVAEQFPELVAGGIEAADPRAAAEFIELVTAAVDDVDPTFFDSFREAVTSGDRVQVDRALRSAEEVLITAVTELGGSLHRNDPGINTAVAIAVAVIAVLLLVAALTVNVVATVNLTVATTASGEPVSTPPGPASMARIDHEKRVDQVAEALAR